MRNIKVDDKFEEQLWRRKEFFKERYNIELNGTALTKAIGRMLELDIIFPLELSEQGLLGIEEIKERKKITSLEITFKMTLPVRNGYKSNKLLITSSGVNGVNSG